MREKFVDWLRERVAPDRWEQIWWIAPAITLLLLPVGAPLLWLCGIVGGYVGWYGVGRAHQGLALFALTSGVVIGSVVLWSAKAAQLTPNILRRAEWLARVAVIGPLLTLFVMFWIVQAIW